MTEEEVCIFIDKFLERAKFLILSKYDKYLTGTQEQKFLVTGLSKYLKSPYMYGMSKLHKPFIVPTESKYWPVVLQVGSQYYVLSKYVDSYLQKFLPFILSYIKKL